MKIIKITAGIFILLLFFCSFSYAAPAGNPSDTKLPYGDGIARLKDTIGSVKVSFDADSVIERELKGSGSSVTDAELEGEWYLLRVGYPIFEDKLEPYVKLGFSHLETSWKQSGTVVIIKGDNELAWGVGARFLAYEIPEYRVKFTLDGQYRTTEPDLDDVTVNNPTRTVSAAEFKISEWQISGIVSMEFPLGERGRKGKSDIYSLVPYVGIGYSDCDIKSKFTYESTNYDIGNAESDNKAVLITGCDLNCPENVSLNVEGRLFGETSVGGGATVKF